MTLDRKCFTILLFMLIGISVSAQESPEGISYQAVARDSRGIELINQFLTVRLSLIQSAPSGEALWIEQHAVTTDAYGLFNLVIGEGTREGGTIVAFKDIAWGKTPIYLKVEVDFGSGFRSMGISPFQAVPYAMYALRSGFADRDTAGAMITSMTLQGNLLRIAEGTQVHTVDLSTLAGTTGDNQQLSYNAATHLLSLQNGGSVDLTNLAYGNDADSTNELISSLALQGNTLEIHEGSHVKTLDFSKFMDNTDNQDLHYDAVNQHISIDRGNSVIDLREIVQTNFDASPTNEIQHLTKVGSIISLDHDGGTIYDADSDSTNELQTLGLNGKVLSISKGNSVTFNFDDADADPTNEIQDLSISGNLLSLTKDPTPAAIDLSAYLDNTDNQVLSVDAANNKLSISQKSGSPQTVSIDADPLNEIQDLQLTGNNLKITKNSSASTISLAPYLDNTDSQTLALSNGSLSISGGNSISIRENQVAFRVVKNSINLINHPDSTILYFDIESVDTQNAYDPSSGTFTVPPGCPGIYSFTVSYSYASTQILRIIRNGQILETLQPFDNYSFLLSLSEGDKIAIRLVNPSTSTTFNNSIGSFIGFRINQ